MDDLNDNLNLLAQFIKVHQVINTTFCNLKVVFLINSDYYSHTQVV